MLVAVLKGPNRSLRAYVLLSALALPALARGTAWHSGAHTERIGVLAATGGCISAVGHKAEEAAIIRSTEQS